MNESKGKSKALSPNLFPVVGIGASAGGLDAFKKFVKVIPDQSGMAYVLVQHLDPNHESLLPELLQKVTSIPVVEISNDIKVMPDHIYIIPSNKMLVANDGVLQLSPRSLQNRNERNLPIDLFFTSLAEVHQGHAIGVVLSGTATDGTAGLKAIKDHGGITFAQDGESAAYESMPNSAVQAGVVDFILSPEKIPRKILELNKRLYGNGNDEPGVQNDEDTLRQIISLLRIRKGTDFTHYKKTTIHRRIVRRMALSKNEDVGAYLNYLRDHKEEQDILYQDLLIPVTSFFRDPKTFDYLRDTIFPLIAKNKQPGEPIRVWVAGCSTGEEAYSVAITLYEVLGANEKKVQVFATDISEPAIAKARKGVYSKTDIASVSPHRLAEFFTRTNDSYQVVKSIRDMCVFAEHNFLKDPHFGKMDFISCRNVLIYMEPYLQKKALTTFHYSLNQKGFLLLGKSETTSGVLELFTAVNKTDKVFSRKDVPGKPAQAPSSRADQSFSHFATNPENKVSYTDFQKAADEILLNNYTPSGVVVNEAMDIVHFRGNTSRYLEQHPGKPSHNLLKMSKRELAFELRNILHKAKLEKVSIVKDNISLPVNDGFHKITLEAIPLLNTIEPYYLVLFHDRTEGKTVPIYRAPKKSVSKTTADEKDLRIQQLEQELIQTNEDMRTIMEDQEASNEELQGDNEELLSTSEELQSLNEEMETSKEELQSTNEELMVVNQEIINLNEQVTEARDYSEAIVATVREPFLVLDKEMRIKTANSAFYRTFEVTRQETEGRLMYEVGDQQWDIPELRVLLEKILPEKSKIEDFEVKHRFKNIGSRIMLLNASEIKRDAAAEKLVLLAIEDITKQRKNQIKESELLNRFQNLVMQAPVAICILKGNDYTVELANDFYLQLVEKQKDFIGKPFFQSLPELKPQGIKEFLEGVQVTGIPYVGNEIEIDMPRNRKVKKGFFNLVCQPLIESDNTVTGIIVVVTEVTDQIMSRKRMEAQAAMVQDLLMTAPGFICTLVGPDHVYELVNERYQNLFGKREIQGKPIMIALPELEGQGFKEILDQVYNSGEPYVGVDVPISLARDYGLAPELRYFNFSYQPIYDENMKIYSILVFGYEVTDQVIAREKIRVIQEDFARELVEKVEQRTAELSEANDSLLKKNQELVKLNRELESFAYVSSHDLQEPLRKIQTFATRIVESEEAALSDRGKDYFRRMQASARRMQALIQDLLAYTRVTNTTQKFVKTDLNEIVEEVRRDFADSIQKTKATFELRNLGEVNVIPFQFYQLMSNLIGNALKFSAGETPPHIIIAGEIDDRTPVEQVDPEGKLVTNRIYYHISVSDNGIGFEPQYNEKIFEVFQRLHDRDKYPGTGIGLAIVKKIVENHDGFITANSELNKGTTFDIYIPLSEGQNTE